MTDRVLARRDEIQQNLEQAAAGYPDLWSQVTRAWRESTSGYHLWLTYAANYLFSFDGFKWALDPFSLSSRVPGVSAPDYLHDLAGLSLIVLTHAHNDHLDVNLVRELSQTQVRWVIPHYVLDEIEARVRIPRERVIIPQQGEEIASGPLRLLPFDSLHMNGAHGVPETGYLVEFGERRWLFPGDIRNYRFDHLPPFGRLDGVVAHLWLGKAQAMVAVPPLLDAFCDFYTRFDTVRLVITHLNEFGRDEHDLWGERHYDLVRTEILRRKSSLRVEKMMMGDMIDLE